MKTDLALVGSVAFLLTLSQISFAAPVSKDEEEIKNFETRQQEAWNTAIFTEIH